MSNVNLPNKSPMLPWLWLSLLVVVLDQASKLFAMAKLELHRPEEWITGLSMTLSYNRGAAFSFLGDAGGWQRWFFLVLAIAVSLFLVHWLKKLTAAEKSVALALALILGGAIGNVIDRAYLGYVVDFIDVYYVAGSCLPLFSAYGGEQCHWPIFNLADSAIFLGAAILIVDSFRRPAKTESE